jgi:hypothetical protein
MALSAPLGDSPLRAVEAPHDQNRRAISSRGTAPRNTARVSSAVMLRRFRSDPMSDEGEVSFEATAPPEMTTDLGIALAQLVRATLARRDEQPKRAA